MNVDEFTGEIQHRLEFVDTGRTSSVPTRSQVLLVGAGIVLLLCLLVLVIPFVF